MTKKLTTPAPRSGRSARVSAATKKKGKPKTPTSKKVKSILDLPLDSDDEEQFEAQSGVEDVDWKDVDLNWSLLNAIVEDSEIKQGLFPSPGLDTRASKGKSKNDYYFAVATVIFGAHEKYQGAFALAKTPAEKGAWSRKVKNRIAVMVKTCRRHTEDMGETGAGITREDEIDMNLSNTFTTKWGIIRESCPWYWVLKELMSERPNLKPVGVGNTTTGFDTSIFTPSTDNNALVEEARVDGMFADTEGTVNSDGALLGDDEDFYEVEDIKPTVPTDTSHKKRTAAKASTSTPASANPSKKAKSAHDRFSEIAVKEEETSQLLLEVKKQKLLASNNLAIAALKAKTDLKRHRDELTIQMVTRRNEQNFQLEMARIRYGSTSHGAQAGPSSSYHTHPPSYSVSAPSGSGSFDDQNLLPVFNDQPDGFGGHQPGLPSFDTSTSGASDFGFN